MPDMQPLRVFLSHLTLETKLAEILQTAITRDFIGLTSFFVSSDISSIPPGDQWERKLIAGLASSSLHIVLCSPESVHRPWINFETGAACLREIPIIPICHSGLAPSQLPSPLSNFQSIVASDLQGLQKLYARIASMLGARSPDAKLKDLAQEIKGFEVEYEKLSSEAATRESASPSVTTIRYPKVLCATSKQFVSLRSEDFDIIQRAFPETTSHRRELTSQAVRDAMLHERFDIVHVATYVCPKTGDLIFSDINFDASERIGPRADILTAAAFSSLIKSAQTKLAVIASCESFELGAELLSVCNVIATRGVISLPMFAVWVESFYGSLQSSSLSEAFDYAVKASRAPMKLYAKENLVMGTIRKKASAAVNT